MSWTGTVRCSYCYQSGHNKTSCPELKKKWEEDPNSYYGRQWQAILDRKAKPKKCSYCGEIGHTRAGCETAKKHKAQFQMDLNLWRQALVKWMKETGLGPGAMVRANEVSYYRNGTYQYPNDDGYIPPVGMYMTPHINSVLTHYAGIMNTDEWTSPSAFFHFEFIGAQQETVYASRRTVHVCLPTIPGIVPRFGKGWYYESEKMDRHERADNTNWEVVSPACGSLKTSSFLDVKELRKATKGHFGAKNDQSSDNFRTFTDFQRTQLRQYVNGEIELSEMKDPEVPRDDS